MTGGWTDTPLTEFGKLQANRLGDKLKEYCSEDEFVLYSSDLKRASQTADVISEYLDLEKIEDKGLREINTGDAIDKTKEWAKLNRNPLGEEGFNIDYREFNGGETWREFYHRISETMERIYSSEEKNLVIVTHGCALGYMIAWWMKFETHMLNNAYFTASPGSISYLFENKYNQHALGLLNERGHLADLV